MVVLHVAYISNSNFSGVSVVVPHHVASQSKFCTCALFNAYGVKIDQEIKQLAKEKEFDVEKLEKPYNNPDIVIFHEVYRKEYLRISKEIIKKGIPYIIVPHSQLTKEAQKRKKIKKIIANRFFYNSFLKNAKAIQCLSESEMENTLINKQKFVSTNGINLPIKKKTTYRDNNMNLVYIGRLESYQKGLDLLIKAVSCIASSFREKGLHLDVYGPDYKGRLTYLKKMIKKNRVEDIVNLHKEVSGREKQEVLLNTDLFIQTSRFEGMPMGILEALSYGIPCIVTHGTTVGAIIESYNSGWSCDTSVSGIVEALGIAINSKVDLLQRMSKNAIELIEKEFNWDTISKKCIDYYKSIINASGK